ncbi:hypothetical protein J2128_000056 [Methanomicrobium sp. W14]|uniref:hypothetical protein n=1 Tax=Methanomicrobium sp. W14 TaxID=2817839 RepID=UPI001AE50394|nr:hypothetical protein [Methanomicrobium sp. W14]MBP2132135.1 hypothetical protein [Methanomicrobium sp. W14]
MEIMDKWKIFAVIIVIAVIACGGYAVLKYYPNLLCLKSPVSQGAGGNTYITYQVSATETPAVPGEGTGSENGESGGVTYIHNGEIYSSPSAIKSMDLYAEPVDWDSDPGNDGIVIHFNFYDEYGRKVVFYDSSISCTVILLSPQTDTLMRTVSPRKVLYMGYTTITSSDQGEGGPLAGIRVAYSDISYGEYTRGIGQIKVSASLPTGGIVTGLETYLYTKN